MGVIFNKCCFCIELKSGCLIIGYQYLICHIILILKLILDMAALSLSTAQDNYKEFREAQVDEWTIGDIMFAAMVTILVIAIIFLAFTIILLVGLHKNKRGLVKAYLIYAVIFFVLYTIMFLVSLGEFADARYLVFHIANILVGTYFLLVIRSYYQTMNPANKPVIYNTA